jgi:hypothetical protein
MSPFLVLWVIFAHWVADFVCQTHWQASNKSKNWEALASHVIVYTVVVTVLLANWLVTDFGDHFIVFLIVTFVAHFVTDAITSRITSRLFMSQFVVSPKWTVDTHIKPDFTLHWFFVVVGFDQFLHYAQLFLTLQWVMSW